MKAYVVQTNLDKPNQIVEVHLSQEDCISAVYKLNQENPDQAFWYVECPLRHRMFVVTEKGKPTEAVIQGVGGNHVSTGD